MKVLAVTKFSQSRECWGIKIKERYRNMTEEKKKSNKQNEFKDLVNRTSWMYQYIFNDSNKRPSALKPTYQSKLDQQSRIPISITEKVKTAA